MPTSPDEWRRLRKVAADLLAYLASHPADIQHRLRRFSRVGYGGEHQEKHPDEAIAIVKGMLIRTEENMGIPQPRKIGE